MRRINVYVRENDYEWMTAVAKVHGRPIAEIIRRAIENYRLVEGQVLGESYLPMPDVTSADCKPSKKDNEMKAVLERLKKIEKFVFGPLANSTELSEEGYLKALPFLPDYMKHKLK